MAPVNNSPVNFQVEPSPQSTKTAEAKRKEEPKYIANRKPMQPIYMLAYF